MNYFKLFLWTIFLSISAKSVQAQNKQPGTYYRYFTVECKKVNSTDFAELKSNDSISQDISFQNLCTSSSKILVAVAASYPKRIEDIKMEIDELIQAKLPKAKIRTTEVISVSDKQNFCE